MGSNTHIQRHPYGPRFLEQVDDLLVDRDIGLDATFISYEK